jgi:hypothetical protein
LSLFPVVVIIEYKVYCFHGIPKLIAVHINRFSDHKGNYYNTKWNVIKNIKTNYRDNNLNFEKPKELDEMLEYAKKLSDKFIHVRVDFYIVNSKIYFGEMTFTDGAGFDNFRPRRFDETLGNLMDLKNIDC